MFSFYMKYIKSDANIMLTTSKYDTNCCGCDRISSQQRLVVVHGYRDVADDDIHIMALNLQQRQQAGHSN